MTTPQKNIFVRFLFFFANCNLYQFAGIVFIVLIPVAGYFLFDFLGAPRRTVEGVILGENQTWSMRRWYRCYVRVETPLGILSDVYLSECRGYWHPGEKVTVQIIFGRITGPEIYGESMKRVPM